MFCGVELGKENVMARKSDGKKVLRTNTGYIKHFEDGRVIAVCQLCKEASSRTRTVDDIMPTGWGKVCNDEDNHSDQRTITMQELYDKLKELLGNNYEVKKCLARLSR